LAGQFLTAVAGPLFCSAVSIIANVWFGDKDRNIATALGSIGIPLGNLVSLVFTGVVFAGYVPEDDEKHGGDDLKSRIKLLLVVQNVIVSFFCISLFLLVKEKPAHPPSRSALDKPVENKMCKELATLLKNKSYVMVLLIRAILAGNFVTVGNLLSPLFKPYDYSASFIASFGAAFTCGGVIGSIIVGIILDKTKAFLRATRLVCFLSCGMIAFTMYAWPTGVAWLAAISCFVSGFVMTPIIPISFSFTVELTHPTPPASANGLMLIVSKLVALLFSLFGGYLADIDPVYALLGMAIAAGVSIIFSFFIKEVLKRSNGDKATAY